MRAFSIFAFLAASPAMADAGGGYGHMGYGMALGPVFGLIIIGLIVAGVIWFVARTDVGNSRPDALAELDMRLARGDIDAEDYANRRKLLRTS